MEEPRRPYSHGRSAHLIGWPGGKTRLADAIIRRLPAHHCYVEVFGGSAAVLLRKPPSASEVYNDTNGDLVNLFRVVKTHPDEFLHEFSYAVASRQLFQWLKRMAAFGDGLTDIQRAARFFYVVQSSFGAKGALFATACHRPSKIRLALLRERIGATCDRLQGITIEQLDYRELIRQYDAPTTVFFLDPPYLGSSSLGHYRMWPAAEHDALAAVLTNPNVEAKWLMTMNDTPSVRTRYTGCRIERVKVLYSIGTARRDRSYTELLIRNF